MRKARLDTALQDSNSVNANKGGWDYLGRELIARTTEPAKSPQFAIYVVGAIVIMGALGIWIEVIKLFIAATATPAATATATAINTTSRAAAVDYNSLITALVTFFLALIGSSAFQLNFKSTGERDKVFASVAVFLIVVFGALAGLLTSLGSHAPVFAVGAGGLCAVFAVWVFWISNGGDPLFQNDAAVDVPTGGNPDRPLPGNTDGFRV